MLLQSIKLENFRLFQNEQITFADGKDDKNVTIILGDNGTGKTTLAQAFRWCLYGETDFSDKVVINRLVANELPPSQSADVYVELAFQHGENFYNLSRKLTYTKDSSGNLKASNAVFSIRRRDKTGNTTNIKPTLHDSEVNGILPKELSKYFFIDGERIERMSKDISTHKKVNDFADAVRSILGLKGIDSAIRHLNPNVKSSVIGVYESSYDSSSNIKIEEFTQTIEECKTEIERINERLEELDRQNEHATIRRNEKKEELKQYKDGETLQSQREDLQQKISAIKRLRSNMVKTCCDDFSAHMGAFFSLWLIEKAMRMLQENDFTGKDIPHMHGDTIEYLLKQKECICGTSLTEGSVPYEKVRALIDFLPPKSLSSSIGDFKKMAVKKVCDARETDIYTTIGEHLAIIRQQEEDLSNLEEDLQAVEDKLSSDDVHVKIRNINAEIKYCDRMINGYAKDHDQCISSLAVANEQMRLADSKRRELALLDEKNKKIEIYKAYAARIYQELLEFYKSHEATIRGNLEDTINEIFKEIYEGGLSLTIDDKYHISVYADNYDGDVETSTAQSIAVIFAFITGVIKMARDNRSSTDEDAKLFSSEPYPLVMDAPLSAFDKRRIETVCTALPKVADQVVIFIKDTDGELAEKYLGRHIGRSHCFEKENEFISRLV